MKIRLRLLRWWPWITFLCLCGVSAFARVGGGQSYSGGHSSSSSSSSSSGSSGFSSGGGSGTDVVLALEVIFEVLYGLFLLTVTHPLIGIPVDLVLVFIIWLILRGASKSPYAITHGSNPTGAPSLSGAALRASQLSVARARLNQLRTQIDPNFSRIAFMDFIHALYARAHHARGPGQDLEALAGYLSPTTIQGLREIVAGVRSVPSVVIGSAVIDQVSELIVGLPTRLSVEFEANYTEELTTGKSQSWYVLERWNLVRAANVKSREPARIRQIGCPACGGPAAADPTTRRCPACGNTIEAGDFDWFVESINFTREEVPPLLTGDVEEAGNTMPTLVDPGLRQGMADLQAQDPSFNWGQFNERAWMIFLQLQKAWSDRNWEIVRPFESDSIFETHTYFINEYKKQRLINTVQNVQLRQMIPAKVMQDKYFSAITLRIYAGAIDFTRTEDGRLVAGSETRSREFTEYWTFIRGRSARPPKPGSGSLNCPACGAGLDRINMAGVCGYCQNKITTGDFDWVLSSIEQDEAYTG